MKKKKKREREISLLSKDENDWIKEGHRDIILRTDACMNININQ
jgi:hypothetical protein